MAFAHVIIPPLAGTHPRWHVHQTNSSPDPHTPAAMPGRNCDSVNI
ncbi:hypothetical protein SC1_00639 [Sphingopyxis sp. C-1]|nr:hypothetical protein SC1_00639 [Sphingopyxis sp. C-1]